MVTIEKQSTCAEQATGLVLKGQAVELREFTHAHMVHPSYHRWLRDIEVVTPLYRVEYLMPISFSKIQAYVEQLMNSENDAYFALYLAESNEFIGTVRLGHIQWRSGVADVGILIGERAHWGKGYAKDAISTLMHYAFQTLSLRRLGAGTPATNTAMSACFKRLGFKQEGLHRECLLINGEYVDHITFGLLKSEYESTYQG